MVAGEYHKHSFVRGFAAAGRSALEEGDVLFELRVR